MWKKLLITSGGKSTTIMGHWSVGVLAHWLKSLFHYSVIPLLLLLLTSSCAPRYIETPSYGDVPIEIALSDLKNILSIEAILSVEYKNKDSAMSGDALLTLSENTLNIRLYYLGFLAGEIQEENGVIKSNPKLDRNKSILLVEGLKNSFFWWNIKDYSIQEKEDAYVLKNSYREIIVNKKTLLPTRQTIEINGKEKLIISYDTPSKAESDSLGNSYPSSWYSSRLNIEFMNHTVDIKVKSYSIFYKSKDSNPKQYS